VGVNEKLTIAIFFMPKQGNHFTPWFELIVNRFLFPWWKDLLDRSQDRPIDAHLIADAQDNTIHRMSP
jgi:isopentenyl-diphosphate delta-isomerase